MMLVTIPLSKNHQCVTTTDFSVIEESVGRGNHCYCKPDMCPKGKFDVNIKDNITDSPNGCVDQAMESGPQSTMVDTDEKNKDRVNNSNAGFTDLNKVDKINASLEEKNAIRNEDTGESTIDYANISTEQSTGTSESTKPLHSSTDDSEYMKVNDGLGAEDTIELTKSSPDNGLQSFKENQEVGMSTESQAQKGIDPCISRSEIRAACSVGESQMGMEEAQTTSEEGHDVLTDSTLETSFTSDTKEEVTVFGIKGSEMSATALTCLNSGAPSAADKEENNVTLEKQVHNVSETTSFASKKVGTVLLPADSNEVALSVQTASSSGSTGSREPQTILESLDSSEPCISGSEDAVVPKLPNSGNLPMLEIPDEIKEPENVRHPLIDKQVLESPHSLRALLSFKDDIPDDIEKTSETKKDEDFSSESKKDGDKPVVSGTESNGNDNHTEPIVYPDKWYENADSEEFTSGTFSGPIAFSGALTYSGLMAYSAPPHSGNISHRSDSSTSTRSFAFPILASDWSSSPVKADPPDTRMNRQGKKWRFCFCFRCSSTTFE